MGGGEALEGGQSGWAHDLLQGPLLGRCPDSCSLCRGHQAWLLAGHPHAGRERWPELAWEAEPRLEGPLGALEKQRIPAAFFLEAAREPLPEAWMPEGFALSPKPSSAGA